MISLPCPVEGLDLFSVGPPAPAPSGLAQDHRMGETACIIPGDMYWQLDWLTVA
jgi:hypothetical protein